MQSKEDLVKDILDKAGSHIVSIKFTKKDGSERDIKVNARMMQGLKGEDASESAKKAVETRKQRNPNLIPVIDFDLYKETKDASQCWRYVNASNVIEMSADGRKYDEDYFDNLDDEEEQ